VMFAVGAGDFYFRPFSGNGERFLNKRQVRG